jgi:hypothetical protein
MVRLLVWLELIKPWETQSVMLKGDRDGMIASLSLAVLMDGEEDQSFDLKVGALKGSMS